MIVLNILVYFGRNKQKSFAALNNLNFHPPEVLSCFYDPQLQVGEDYSYLFNLRSNICKS